MSTYAMSTTQVEQQVYQSVLTTHRIGRFREGEVPA